MGNIWIAGSHDFYLVEEVCHFPPLGPGPVPQERFIYIYLSYQSRWSKKVSAEDPAAIIREPHSSNTDSCSHNDIRIKHRNKKFIQPQPKSHWHLDQAYEVPLFRSAPGSIGKFGRPIANHWVSEVSKGALGTCILWFSSLFSGPRGYRFLQIYVCSRIATAPGYSCVKCNFVNSGKFRQAAPWQFLISSSS